MDTALINGDFAENETGKIYAVSGMNETVQRCKILLGIQQGSFCYNRKLGGNLHLLSPQDEYLDGNALLLVREALLPVKQVEVVSVIPLVQNENISLSVTIRAYGETAEFEVNI
ncbi:MAG: histidine kinase [Clostridia bacterium]|nr:histidine kinase [Clostridia bacterium]